LPFSSKCTCTATTGVLNGAAQRPCTAAPALCAAVAGDAAGLALEASVEYGVSWQPYRITTVRPNNAEAKDAFAFIALLSLLLLYFTLVT
jgi:hypothetical protein